MMVALLLLALLGSCWGLQPDLEYQYRYSGRVAAGIPSLKHQFSGAGIQADVTVQRTKEHHILVQISNVHVGDFHDELKCDIQEPLPIEYHPMEEGADLLSKPFVVHLNNTEIGDFLDVPVEPAWVTNIRRAVVNIFRVAPLRVNFGGRAEEVQRPLFGVVETTIPGHCRNWYSLIRLSEEEAAQENQRREAEVEDDVQRDAPSDSYTAPGSSSKTKKTSVKKGVKRPSSGSKSPTKSGAPAKLSSVANIDDHLWLMTRNLDFSTCEDLVALKLHGHKNTDEKISRASVGTYLLRGDESGLRIERAVIEGSVSVFADIYGQDHVDTLTKQTLELRAVRQIQEELVLDYEPHHDQSWQYQVDHHLPDTMQDVGVHPSLEQVVTGVSVKDTTITDAKTFIVEALESIVTHLTTSPHPSTSLSEKLGKVADVVALLSREEIDSLEALVPQDDPHYNEKIDIIHQALVTAGTGPSISHLLDKMSNITFRHNHVNILLSFLEDIHASVKNPLLISKLMELLVAMPWEDVDEFVKPIGLMNLAKLANELCLNAEKRETFGSNTCDPEHTCDPHLIIDNLLPVLVQGLQDEEAPVWRRVVYLQALANLGTPQTITVLKHIILGDRESHIGLRMNAILSLSPVYMPRTVYTTVFNILMPIFDNKGEHYEVRNVAFLVMAMWEPSVSWWQRMAVSTWREPSSQVASFVTSVITSFAHGQEPVSQRASRVVHRAKPAALPSLTRSSAIFLHEYLLNCKWHIKLSLAWLASTGTLFPASVFVRLQENTITGFTHDWKITIHQRVLGDLWTFLSNIETGGKPQGYGLPTEAFGIVSDIYQQIKDQLGVEPSSKEPELTLWVKLQQVYLSARAVVLNSRTGLTVDPFLTHFINTGQDPPEYHRHVDTTIALPTDLGLPILLQYSEQTASWHTWTLTGAGISLGPPIEKRSSSILFDISHDSTLEVKTLLPWSQKFAVGAGLHNVFSVFLPHNLHSSYNSKHKTLKYKVEPITTDPVELVSSHNHPYTVVTGPFPTVLHTLQNDCKTIKIADTELYSLHRHPLPSMLGLEVESIWSADFDFPLNFGTLYSGALVFNHPSYRTWDYSIVLTPEASVTKSITFTFDYETLQTSASIVQEQSFEDLGQETQVAADYADYSQVSQSASSDDQEVNETETFEMEQSSQARALIAKLQQEFLPASGGSVETVSVRMELRGVPTRSYEAVLTWVMGTSPARADEGVQPKSFSKVQFTLLENVPEGQLGQAHVTCLKLQIQTPSFLPLPHLDEVLNTTLITLLDAELYDGFSCEESPVLKIRGTTSVSKEGLQHVQSQVVPEGPGCHGEPALDPIDIITSSLYDGAHFNITWTQDLPGQVWNLTYYVDDIVRCALFPRLSYDHTVSNPDNVIEIDASKRPETNQWTVRTTMPSEVSIIHDLVLTPQLELLTTPAGPTQTFYHEYVHGHQPLVCTVEFTKVKTFDGLVLPFEPSNCWITADAYFTDQSQGFDAEEGVVQVRFTEEWEVRILWPARGILLEMTRSHLLMNGVEYENTDQHTQFQHLQDSTLLSFTSGYAIRISDKVEILGDITFRSKIVGVCGNMDGEKTFDMVGPLGCIYNDPALYALAWTTSGDNCNAFFLRAQKQKKKVVEFQETCHKRTFVPTGVSHKNAVYDCTEWVYQEHVSGDYSCKALVPTPTCKPECQAMFPVTEPIEYDCEVTGRQLHEEAAPKECYSHIISTTYPAACGPH